MKDKKIPTAIRGTISELVAANWLMERGFYVYRAESPAAPFDLVAVKGDQLYRIEVRSRGTHHSIAKSERRDLDEGKYDLLAYVTGDKVAWFPISPYSGLRRS